MHPSIHILLLALAFFSFSSAQKLMQDTGQQAGFLFARDHALALAKKCSCDDGCNGCPVGAQANGNKLQDCECKCIPYILGEGICGGGGGGELSIPYQENTLN